MIKSINDCSLDDYLDLLHDDFIFVRDSVPRGHLAVDDKRGCGMALGAA